MTFLRLQYRCICFTFVYPGMSPGESRDLRVPSESFNIELREEFVESELKDYRACKKYIYNCIYKSMLIWNVSLAYSYYLKRQRETMIAISHSLQTLEMLRTNNNFNDATMHRVAKTTAIARLYYAATSCWHVPESHHVQYFTKVKNNSCAPMDAGLIKINLCLDRSVID